MRRRALLGLLTGGAILPHAVRSQQRPLVAVLDPGFPQHFAMFSKGMEELGYLDGQTVSYVYRSAEGKPDAGRRLASELVSVSPQVIVTAGPPAIRALKEATSTIP